MDQYKDAPAFWFVWNTSGNAPRYRHESENSAIAEAERLARRHPGQEFIVLESVCSMRVNDIERIDLRPDGCIPF